MEKTLENKKVKDFTQVENCILRNRNISRNAKLVYMILESYDFDGKGCFPGQERIATELGVSASLIRDALRELRGWGLISWRQQGLNKPNIYTIEEIPVHIKDEYEIANRRLRVIMKDPEAIPSLVKSRKEGRRLLREYSQEFKKLGRKENQKR